MTREAAACRNEEESNAGAHQQQSDQKLPNSFSACRRQISHL
jgi:hypothetical protein